MNTRQLSPYLLLFPLMSLGAISGLISASSFNLQWHHLTEALIYDAQSLQAQLITSLRLPRVILAALIGASLAVAGALMQGITRNPLASPSLLGINAGAACTIMLATTGIIAPLNQLPLVITAAIGATFAGALVMLLGGGLRGQLHPMRTLLSGIAVSAALMALTRAALILDEQAQAIISWLSGSLADTGWQHVGQIWPWILPALLLSLVTANSFNLLALGDDVARGLGVNPSQVRLTASALVIVLAASAAAVAGPVSFVGLMVPHLMRQLIGQDYRLLLPLCALGGATLMIWADALSRHLAFPAETPVGILTALTGAPFFLWLACRSNRSHA